MDLVQRFVIGALSRRKQLTPERRVLFPAQAQLMLVFGGDLIDIVRPKLAKHGRNRGRHAEQKTRSVRVGRRSRPGQNQGLSHQFIRELRWQATRARRSKSAVLSAASPAPPVGVEKLNIHQQQDRSRRTPSCWHVQLAPKRAMLIDNPDSRRELPRVSDLNERFHAALIQLTNESQRMSSPPVGRQESCRGARRTRSFIWRWHALRLIPAPADIVTLRAKKCVSGFACRHARNTVHRLPSTGCRTHGKERS